MTSNLSWKKRLLEKLRLPVPNDHYRVAFVGVGAELNGDDAVGPFIIRKLLSSLGQKPNLLVLDGGTLPENTTGSLRRFVPNLVVLIDAADFGGVPGEIRLLQPGEVTKTGFSTHAMSLALLADYLLQEFRCDVLILGIQPERVDFGESLSSQCEISANMIVNEIEKLFVH